MKKVLHIGKYYPPCCGGIEQVVYDIASGLKDKNYVQKVICFNTVPTTLTETYKGVEVTRVGFKLKTLSQPITFEYFFLLKKMFTEFSPDIVHLHLPNPLIATFVLHLIPKKTKLILHWHSDIIRQKIIRVFYQPFERAIIKRANTIIAATSYHVDFSSAIKKQNNKTVIIPFCIDTSKFTNVAKIERKAKRLFFLGRHVPYKGLQYLIQAADYIDSEAEIIIGGTGILTPTLKEAAANKPNIHFVGQIPDEQVAEYFATSQVFLFPSITKNEAFGIAMIEAMYFGLPVVSFAIQGSGVNWVNQHEKTGFSVENKNVKKFADAVNLLLSDADLYAELSHNAHDWAIKQFNKDGFIEKIIQVYER